MQIVLRRKGSQGGNDCKQPYLGKQHPSPSPAKQRQGIAVQQGRPQEFPGIGKLDQSEQADSFQIKLFATQPGWDQVEEQVQRQAGAEAGKHTNQHAPREQLRKYVHKVRPLA